MASNQDIYFEVDGVRLWFGDITTNGTQTITIPALSVVYKAQLQATIGTHIAVPISGGCSGNCVEFLWYQITGSGIVTSGAGVSGSVIQVIAMGT